MNVFTVAPCSRHRCCIGCVSLRGAVPIICVAELVVIGLCSLIAIDFYVTDGFLFYTKETKGQGLNIAIVFAAFLTISFPVIILTLSAWHYRKPYLYVVHVIWQWTILEILLYFTYTILQRVFSSEIRKQTGFLLPSAIVLSVGCILALWIHSWWLFVFIDAMFFESSSKDRRKQSTNDSGDQAVGNSSTVEQSKSVDTTLLGNQRQSTLPTMDKIPMCQDVSASSEALGNGQSAFL